MLRKKPVQMHMYYFLSKESTELDSIYKSKFDFVSSHAEEKKQALDETHHLFPHAIKLRDQQLSLISTKD